MEKERVTRDEMAACYAPHDKTDDALEKAGSDSINDLHAFLYGLQEFDGSGLNAFGDGASGNPALYIDDVEDGDEVEDEDVVDEGGAVDGGNKEVVAHEMEEKTYLPLQPPPGEFRF